MKRSAGLLPVVVVLLVVLVVIDLQTHISTLAFRLSVVERAQR